MTKFHTMTRAALIAAFVTLVATNAQARSGFGLELAGEPAIEGAHLAPTIGL